jgi:hypothetical protein
MAAAILPDLPTARIRSSIVRRLWVSVNELMDGILADELENRRINAELCALHRPTCASAADRRLSCCQGKAAFRQ